jgi:hypothetical protein
MAIITLYAHPTLTPRTSPHPPLHTSPSRSPTTPPSPLSRPSRLSPSPSSSGYWWERRCAGGGRQSSWELQSSGEQRTLIRIWLTSRSRPQCTPHPRRTRAPRRRRSKRGGIVPVGAPPSVAPSMRPSVHWRRCAIGFRGVSACARLRYPIAVSHCLLLCFCSRLQGLTSIVKLCFALTLLSWFLQKFPLRVRVVLVWEGEDENRV